jgi:hypothetical protein
LLSTTCAFTNRSRPAPEGRAKPRADLSVQATPGIRLDLNQEPGTSNQEPANEFAKGRQRRYGSGVWQLIKEFGLFLRQEKKWWLVPLIVVLLALGALILFSGSSALAPFMYPFM